MISIYGKSLRKKFKEAYDYSPINIDIKVTSLREVFLALESQFKGFTQLLKDHPYYMIKRGKSIKDSKYVPENEMDIMFEDQHWYIIPVPCGSASLTWAAVGYFLLKVAVVMAISYAISYLLAPAPNKNNFEDQQKSYMFDGPINTSKPGSTIPVVYGDTYVGSVVVSSGSDTLNINVNKTTTILNTVHVLSEGEIEGPSNDDDWYKSVYLDETQVESDSGDRQYDYIEIEGNEGTVDQDALTGFDDIQNETIVGAVVEQAGAPITRTITDLETDDLKVTLRWAALFRMDSDGDTKRLSVNYRVTVTPDNGAGSEQDAVVTDIFTGDSYWHSGDQQYNYGSVTKATFTSFDVQKKIENLSSFGVGPWVIKVYRLTADHNTSRKVSEFQWHSFTEIKNIKMQYPDTAVVGIKLDARDFGGRLPNSMVFKIKGIKIQIPSNYDPITRIYTGVWNGSFTTAYSNNPAWVLYDIIINDRYGIGEYITTSEIDKYSLYTAGAYCDETVSYNEQTKQVNGSYISTLESEPRFVFNGSIIDQDQALAVVNNICSSLMGYPVWAASQVSIIQDSPTDRTRIATPGNVIDGMFEYQGVGNDQKTNIVRMAYANPDNFGNAETVVYQDEASIAINGTNPVDIVAIGCTSRSETLRKAKFVNYTNTHQNDLLTFRGGLEWADCYPGEVIGVQDPNYAEKVLSGRVLAATNAQVTVDRDIEIEGGVTYTLYIPDGTSRTVHEWVLNNSPATTDTLTWAAPLTYTPEVGYPFEINTSNVAIRDFQVTGVKEVDTATYEVSGVQYNPTKYAEIEDSIVVEAPQYSDADEGEILPPYRVVVQPYAKTVGDKTNMIYGSVISWQASEDKRVLYYEVSYALDSVVFNEAGTTSDLSLDHTDLLGGDYIYAVRSVAATGVSRWSYSANITVYNNITKPGPPQFLEVEGGGTVFDGKHCTIDWIDSTGSTYAIVDATGVYSTEMVYEGNTNIQYYKVEIYTIGDSLLRTEYTKSRTDTKWIYAFEDNFTDNSGSPIRQIKFKVYSVNIDDVESNPTILIASNPAPDMSSTSPDTESKGGYIKIEWDTVNDNDMDYYELVVDGTAVQSISYPETDAEYHDVLVGSVYAIQIRPYDLFGVGVISQSENGEPLYIPSGNIDIDVELTQSITMTDSDTNTPTTLLKLYNRDKIADGVSYTLSGSDKWIQYAYEITNYIDRVAVWTADANARIYMAMSDDKGSTWTYYKADTGHAPSTDDELLVATNQADAITNYWQLASGFNYALFPNNQIANRVRLYMTGTYSTTIYEYVPARELIAELAVIDHLSSYSANIGTIIAGSLQSSDYGSSEGVLFDLNSKDLRMGGYTDPAFEYDGGTKTMTLRSDDGKTTWTDNAISVFDAGDTLRVKIGKLT